MSNVRVQDPFAFTVVTVIREPLCLTMSVDFAPYFMIDLRITHGYPNSWRHGYIISKLYSIGDELITGACS